MGDALGQVASHRARCWYLYASLLFAYRPDSSNKRKWRWAAGWGSVRAPDAFNVAATGLQLITSVCNQCFRPRGALKRLVSWERSGWRPSCRALDLRFGHKGHMPNPAL